MTKNKLNSPVFVFKAAYSDFQNTVADDKANNVISKGSGSVN